MQTVVGTTAAEPGARIRRRNVVRYVGQAFDQSEGRRMGSVALDHRWLVPDLCTDISCP